MIATEIFIGFSNMYGMHKFGETRRMIDIVLLVIAMVPRFIDFVCWNAFRFSGYTARDKEVVKLRIFLLLQNTVFFIVFIIVHLTSEEAKDANIIIRLWFYVEYTSKGIELVRLSLRAFVFPRVLKDENVIINENEDSMQVEIKKEVLESEAAEQEEAD